MDYLHLNSYSQNVYFKKNKMFKTFLKSWGNFPPFLKTNENERF